MLCVAVLHQLKHTEFLMNIANKKSTVSVLDGRISGVFSPLDGAKCHSGTAW